MILMWETHSLLPMQSPCCTDTLGRLPAALGPLNLIPHGHHPPDSLAQWRVACHLGQRVGSGREALEKPMSLLYVLAF